MLGFLIAVHAIISLLLILVVLMQASQGGGLSGQLAVKQPIQFSVEGEQLLL